MPLKRSINSDFETAPFFDGEDIAVMQGSIISNDSKIGGCTYIGFNCHISKATIGRYVSIADSVFIGLGEHVLDEISTSSRFYEDPYSVLTERPCVVEADAWIGAGSIIRRGVTVGIGAVVGANSFVNRDVPAYSIVAGSPARVIGRRFEGREAEIILASRWWLHSSDEAARSLASLKREIGAGVLA